MWSANDETILRDLSSFGKMYRIRHLEMATMINYNRVGNPVYTYILPVQGLMGWTGWLCSPFGLIMPSHGDAGSKHAIHSTDLVNHTRKAPTAQE